MTQQRNSTTMPQLRYSQKEVVAVNCDGVPAAIVAVNRGEPLVLFVSEATLTRFNAVKVKMATTHVELANMLRDLICRDGGQFHENSVMYHLENFLRAW